MPDFCPRTSPEPPPRMSRIFGQPLTVADHSTMMSTCSSLSTGHARFLSATCSEHSDLMKHHARCLSADLPTVISKNIYEMWTSVDRRRAAQDERHILRPKDGSCPIFVRDLQDLPTVIYKNMYEMWTSVDRRRAAQDERHILRPKDGSCPIFVRGPPHSDLCGHPWTVAEQPRMNVISSVLRMGHARFLSADLPTVISKNMYEMWTSVDRRRAAQDERHILRPKDGSCPIFVRGPPSRHDLEEHV